MADYIYVTDKTIFATANMKSRLQHQQFNSEMIVEINDTMKSDTANTFIMSDLQIATLSKYDIMRI